MVETLKKKYEKICSLESELFRANHAADKIKDAEGDFFGFLDSEKSNLDNILKEIKNKKQKIIQERDSLCVEFVMGFWHHYRIGISFQDGVIVCDESTLEDDSQLQQYENTLIEYSQLLYKEGFNDESEFSQVSESSESICSFIKLLNELLDFIVSKRRENPRYMEGFSIDSIGDKIQQYEDLRCRYEYFISILNGVAQAEVNEDNIDYIINNTSIVPLVYANNQFSVIGKKRL